MNFPGVWVLEKTIARLLHNWPISLLDSTPVRMNSPVPIEEEDIKVSTVNV